MDIYEVTGYRTGIDRAGVNFLDPIDAFEVLRNGFIYRQVLQSRLGFSQFANRLLDGTRVMGIFENVVPATGERELLVISKDFLYTYNSSTNTFDQIPFTSAVPIVSFGIVNNEDYVSGTTYLTKTGGQRFVFTGKGMSDVYFYDGAGVKRFTNAVDNPDYQAPATGALTRATMVLWFGERINFFVPLIGGLLSQQGVLYSGIRDSAGNGDKFNVVGSGLLSCDTYELMKGAIILGDVIVMNLQRSSWVLEKTRDVFNPYFTRKIPSVLGTDAGFSAVVWNYEAKSLGKTGLITTDSRKQLRFDNKIPYFTADDIDQTEFEMTYGGFDRINGQFLFSYRDDLSNLAPITQDRVLVYNYEFSTWSINNQRFSVFGQTNQGQNLSWIQIDETENPAWARMDETEEIWNKIGITKEVQKTLAGDDLGFVYQINTDYDDYFVDITAITQAPSVTITVDPSAFQMFDRVTIANVVGMLEINGMVGTVIGVSLTSLILNIDSTNFSLYVSGGSVSKLIDFEAEMSPFNPYRSEGMKVYISHIEVLLGTNGGDVYVDMYADEEESPFKFGALVASPTTTTKARIWSTITVNQEANFITFVLRNESAGAQTLITSIRIHASRGALTSS